MEPGTAIPILASPALDLAPEQSQFEPALLDGDKFDLSASARGSVNAWRPAAFTTRPRGRLLRRWCSPPERCAGFNALD